MHPYRSTEPGFLECHRNERDRHVTRLRVGIAIALVLDVVLAAEVARQWGWW